MKMRSKWHLMAVLGLSTPCFLSQLAYVPTLNGEEFARRHNMPPAARLAEPGPMVGGPGPGVLAPQTIPVPGMGAPANIPTMQVQFLSDGGSMTIHYDSVGDGTFGSEPLVTPARQEFAQGGIYRLKLTDITGREGIELYPTIEIGTASYRTAAFLAHNALAVRFTANDIDQALENSFVTKVIYLPDPEFQGTGVNGVDTLVSEPGLDPIFEADRRGSILAIIRLGNKDVELSGNGGLGLPMAGMMGMEGACGPDGMPINGQMNPPNMVAGVTAPQYGMTYTGTPIGLAGPPHIPLGHPAGLQKHIMRNHTHMNIPDPVEKMKIHVRHQPGYSYPQPPSRAYIREQNIHPGYPAGAPKFQQASRVVAPNQFGGPVPGAPNCPPGEVR
jgi:hypothetical protein